jgi:hypothetical protein
MFCSKWVFPRSIESIRLNAISVLTPPEKKCLYVARIDMSFVCSLEDDVSEAPKMTYFVTYP